MESKRKVWKGAERRGEDYDTKAGKVLSVEPDWDYVHNDYAFHSGGGNTISNGLLIVGTLKPNKASLPEFWFRWDEKYRRLDVDIHGVNKAAKRAFKDGKNGCSGHHPEKAGGNMREEAFEVAIRMCGTELLRGRLRFRVSRDMAVKIGVDEVGMVFHDVDIDSM